MFPMHANYTLHSLIVAIIKWVKETMIFNFDDLLCIHFKYDNNHIITTKEKIKNSCP